MYAALWRVLPGPVWLKIIQVLLLLTAVVAVLFLWAFPALAENFNLLDTTVGEGG